MLQQAHDGDDHQTEGCGLAAACLSGGYATPPTPMQHTFALKFTLINHMTLSLSITKGEARNRLVRIVCIHSATIICQNGTKLCRLVTVT